jgi:hypothetical protein
MPPLRASDSVGGNPRAGYWQMVYELEADEALIIEAEIPNARYWSLQVADMWWQTLDYAHHHSSLNGHQAQLDPDGKCRLVISPSDPGVPNWIDTLGVNAGIALGRWYLADRNTVPTVTKAQVRDVRSHLPPDTPITTPDERRTVIERRKRAVLRRYGF